MEALTSSSSIPKLPLIRHSSTNRNGLANRRKLFLVNAKQGESEGKSVDENTIVLKMRIKKMKRPMEASKDKDHRTRSPSSDGRNIKSSESKYSLSRDHGHEDVFEAIEILWSYFTKNRPSVALGAVALLVMSLPLSDPDFLTNALKIVKGLLAGCHVCIDIDI